MSNVWSYGVAEIVLEDGTVDCYRPVEIRYDNDGEPRSWCFDVDLIGDTVESLATWLERAAEDVRDNDGKPHVRVYFDEVTARDEYPDGLDYMPGKFLIGKQELVSVDPKEEK
jgi:hypothetical protein